jgi:hypothetical protein
MDLPMHPIPGPADGIRGSDGKHWHCSMDAMAWAKAFVAINPDTRLAQLHGDGLQVDTTDAMLGWFANAIMAGYDESRRRPADEDTSDGYHTFRELYEHRHALFLALMAATAEDCNPWFSLKHGDGGMFEGFFVAGMDVRTGEQQWERVTYHLPVSDLGAIRAISHVIELPLAPEWDGHTAADVQERLMRSATWQGRQMAGDLERAGLPS